MAWPLASSNLRMFTAETVRCLVGSGTQATLQRRQRQAVAHQQTGRLLPENAAHPRRQIGHPDPDGWIQKPLARRNPNLTAVALANKNARIVGALLANDREFRVGPGR